MAIFIDFFFIVNNINLMANDILDFVFEIKAGISFIFFFFVFFLKFYLI